ncbi:3-oxoacyl-ACP reductase FabG [Hydrocarboniclastica marina]|uniref:3-oxoacyl-[acyl-carrier-protein] reductase n=1 Tax=Hydrocarboniclastica marina TaxID=2259620 RepID=A0A4P7XF87_9ALTE|nr:3-oxoacyl-ACP reductase FabG [Hydrocarboniclastica marina]QCF25601.1 3-oxoacyl-ACP reductase FabG [Hydrocarboniclastica marina]
MTLDGKVALVTGATRGIGRAIAHALAESGATVIGTATTEGGANAISEAFQTHGLQGRGMVMDVSDAASVDAGIKAIVDDFGSPAVLVNNAGITRDGLALRMKDEDWQDVIETNLTSTFRTTKAVLRGMTKARWGRIINISSVVASMGNPGQMNYCASKAGIEGMTRSLAREIGNRGITVNCVAPGFIDTDMTKALSDAQRAQMLMAVPVQRLGEPEEIAAVVAFLASPVAGYITGETLHVNGGMYMG